MRPLSSPIIRKYTKQTQKLITLFNSGYVDLNNLMLSKDTKCILMFLSAMPRGVSVAHMYVLILPLHHL